MENDKLYNNMPGLREPDWSQFERLELAGCTLEEGETIGDVSADEAQFFTVYGRGKTEEGYFEAITDCPTALDALTIGATLSYRSRLPLVLTLSLTPTAEL